GMSMRYRRPIHWLWGLTPALALSAPAESAGQTYDPSADFSATANPNGVWSYGSSASLGGALTLYPNHVHIPEGLDVWSQNTSGDLNPAVAHNGTGSPIVLGGSGNLTYPAGQLGLHPGPTGQYSVVRWTAPAAGSVVISGSFYHLDSTTTDVHVLKN